MKPKTVLLITTIFLLSCAPEAKPAQDVSTCTELVKTKLYAKRNLVMEERKQGPEFYVLVGESKAAQNLAVDFMERHGWHAWASTKPEDENKFYFVPDKEKFRPDLPLGKLDDGPSLACQASKLSGLTFQSVLRRSADLSTVVYEFKP